jgi:hypothetical protein
MRQCQHAVEQQLVVKGNDIRRVSQSIIGSVIGYLIPVHQKRDIIIKNLESRVKSLETLLAKQLDSKARSTLCHC